MNYESNQDEIFFEDFDKLCGIYQTVPYFKKRLQFYWKLLACTMHSLENADLHASFRFSWENNEIIIQETGQMKFATFDMESVETEFNSENKHQFYEEWYDEVLSCLLSLRKKEEYPEINLNNIYLQTFLPGEVPITLMDAICEKEHQIYFKIGNTKAYVTPVIQAYLGVSIEKLLFYAIANTEKNYSLAETNLEAWAIENHKDLYGLSDFIKNLPIFSITHDSFSVEMIYYTEFKLAIKTDTYLIPLSKKDILLLDANLFSEHNIMEVWKKIKWQEFLMPYFYNVKEQKTIKIKASEK